MKNRLALVLFASVSFLRGSTNWWLLPQTPPVEPILGSGAVPISYVLSAATSLTCQMPCQLKTFRPFLSAM